MTEETIETEGTRSDRPVSHTTVIREKGSSGGTGIAIAVILLIAVFGGIYLFSQSNSNQAVRDNAIANAANSVGNAADKVGNAAEKAADSVDKQ